MTATQPSVEEMFRQRADDIVKEIVKIDKRVAGREAGNSKDGEERNKLFIELLEIPAKYHPSAPPVATAQAKRPFRFPFKRKPRSAKPNPVASSEPKAWLGVTLKVAAIIVGIAIGLLAGVIVGWVIQLVITHWLILLMPTLWAFWGLTLLGGGAAGAAVAARLLNNRE